MAFRDREIEGDALRAYLNTRVYVMEISRLIRKTNNNKNPLLVRIYHHFIHPTQFLKISPFFYVPVCYLKWPWKFFQIREVKLPLLKMISCDILASFCTLQGVIPILVMMKGCSGGERWGRISQGAFLGVATILESLRDLPPPPPCVSVTSLRWLSWEYLLSTDVNLTGAPAK